ncbi:MAG: dUTP diphosphatase [Clostridia bacterium]|nr:dUTP diphosphatase [Clostridia bacterium]
MRCNLKIKVLAKLTRGASLPKYATDGSAAVDLRAALEGGRITVMPGARAMVPTGLAISPDTGCGNVVAVIAARSGLACRHGICLANGIGVIDSDYRGEILVTLFNSSDVPFEIADGDRIAQMMFMPVMQAEFIAAETLDETERGAGGFGHTGIK